MLEDQMLLHQKTAKEGGDAHGRVVICAGVSRMMVADELMVADPVGDSAMWQSGGHCGFLEMPRTPLDNATKLSCNH
jgi:hypothetical protein